MKTRRTSLKKVNTRRIKTRRVKTIRGGIDISTKADSSSGVHNQEQRLQEKKKVPNNMSNIMNKIIAKRQYNIKQNLKRITNRKTIANIERAKQIGKKNMKKI